MASLKDIPTRLLEPFARKPFLGWLALQKIDPSAKRRLMKAYSDVLETTFTADELRQAGALDAD